MVSFAVGGGCGGVGVGCLIVKFRSSIMGALGHGVLLACSMQSIGEEARGSLQPARNQRKDSIPAANLADPLPPRPKVMFNAPVKTPASLSSDRTAGSGPCSCGRSSGSSPAIHCHTCPPSGVPGLIRRGPPRRKTLGHPARWGGAERRTLPASSGLRSHVVLVHGEVQRVRASVEVEVECLVSAAVDLDSHGEDVAVDVRHLEHVSADDAVVVFRGVGAPVTLEAVKGVGVAGGMLLPVLVLVPDGVGFLEIVLLNGAQELIDRDGAGTMAVPGPGPVKGRAEIGRASCRERV